MPMLLMLVLWILVYQISVYFIKKGERGLLKSANVIFITKAKYRISTFIMYTIQTYLPLGVELEDEPCSLGDSGLCGDNSRLLLSAIWKILVRGLAGFFRDWVLLMTGEEEAGLLLVDDILVLLVMSTGKVNQIPLFLFCVKV